MVSPVSIMSIGSVSPLGSSPDEVWESYLDERAFITRGALNVPVAILSQRETDEVAGLRDSNPHYRHLDNSVLYAILASRRALRIAGWNDGEFGINIGSSRGATGLFEKHHSEFINTGITGAHTSPVTTLGNIASWVAQDVRANGPDISHSITCSTALHAVLNGVAWLSSGMADRFLVGGSEAPLTPFTIAQMQGMKIYSQEQGEHPVRALDLEKKGNTMVLGEGAAMTCLQAGKNSQAHAYIDGIGYATEMLEHGASLSATAECLQKAMRMAIKDINPAEVDAVVMHAPGTVKGDLSEYRAIQEVFGGNLPLLTTNKWKIGHTFGASGLLSLELAVLMLQHNKFVEAPFYNQETGRDIKKVLVNAVGFGGNAVSVLVSK
ncbi:beta-ketoacyl synthase [Flavobacterium sp. MFBS3-15]|uniref:beta-ketoacyl synthase N-terminal-like domain-containing protein n=1 Tax=Flavobacterium sp. MFBS3-15 TaxID=2989816 RepID=UPI002235853C|nr:beta-ketoacyl synthase N-terminal-like domain-containing protein [Flavobacterium sp. MFBS3-15]MCW4470304.1 beta-ketoacyl synthase [Flavobacterium sp. MFBS3-15]